MHVRKSLVMQLLAEAVAEIHGEEINLGEVVGNLAKKKLGINRGLVHYPI